MKFSIKQKILLMGLLVSVASFADLATDINRASDEQILVAGKKMAEALAQTAPSQIDKTTVLRGGIFSKGTKTLIYQYDSSIPLDPSKMYTLVGRQMCLDPIKFSFMKRGIRYRHDYTPPVGLQTVTIGVKDC